MPINRKHPIAELLDACWHYVERQNARNVTFEYVMLDGVNDRPEHARELVAAAARPARQGQPDPVQSVSGHAVPPLAPTPRSSGSATCWSRAASSRPMRRTRGDDIDAACGQLVGRVNDRTTVRLGQKMLNVSVVQS